MLRERLGARPAPQDHPDADLLSAYAEKALPAAEHGRIVTHLAACGVCREIVALSLPQVQEGQIVVQPAPRPRFWALGFRWATVVATLAVAATLFIEKPWHKPSENKQAQIAPVAAPVANDQTPAANNQAQVNDTVRNQNATNQAASSPATEAPAQSSYEFHARAARRETPNRAQAPAESETRTADLRDADDGKIQALNLQSKAASGGVVGGAVGGRVATAARERGYVNRALFEEAASPRVTSVNGAAAPAGASPETAKVMAAAPLVEAPAPKKKDEAQGLQAFKAPPLSADQIPAMAAAPTVDLDKTAAAPPPPRPSSNGKIKDLWSGLKTGVKTVAEAGSGQSSGGNAGSFTNDHVRFTPPAYSRPALGLGGFPGAQHWSISPDGKLMKSADRVEWHEAYPQDQDLRFRVVVTEGQHEIWAGGTHLTLIHSWDGGINWDKLNVSEGSGDITNIKIDDGAVQVKTSNGQTLVSNDNGKTWTPLKNDTPQ